MRTCENCDAALSWRARSDARFCSGRCRVAAHRSGPPAELTDRSRWVRAYGKRPIQTDGSPASSTDPATWTTYAAVNASKAGDGFGIMLGGGIGCYDLDHIDDADARRFADSITEPIIYAERSVSGEGVHVFVAAPEVTGWKRCIDGISVERYARARFIRVTGRRFDLSEV